MRTIKQNTFHIMFLDCAPADFTKMFKCPEFLHEDTGTHQADGNLCLGLVNPGDCRASYDPASLLPTFTASPLSLSYNAIRYLATVGHFRQPPPSVTSVGHFRSSFPSVTSVSRLRPSLPSVTSFGHFRRSLPSVASVA